MLSDRAKELINAAVDNELTAAEKEELDALLADSPEARELSRDLERLVKTLEETPAENPPPQLRQRILESVDLTGGRSRFNWRALWGRPQPAAWALTFAVGLLVAVAFYELISAPSAPLDVSDLVGTMAADRSIDGTSRLDSFSLGLEAVQGEVSLNSVEDLLVLEFDLASPEAIEITVELENSGLAFSGFAAAGGAGDPMDAIDVSGGAMRVVNHGKHKFAVFLRGRAPRQDISVGITQNGNLVYEGTLRPGR